jgi:hypothetical protein
LNWYCRLERAASADNEYSSVKVVALPGFEPARRDISDFPMLHGRLLPYGLRRRQIRGFSRTVFMV